VVRRRPHEQQAIGTRPGGGVPLGHILPVHHAPHRLAEVDLLVPVPQIERVLPRVEDQQPHRALAHVSLVVVRLLDHQPPAHRSYAGASHPEPCAVAAAGNFPLFPTVSEVRFDALARAGTAVADTSQP
jgi:hypothetical protein